MFCIYNILESYKKYRLCSMYNSQLEDIFIEFKLFTSTGVRTRNIFMWNKKIVVLRTTAHYIVYTIKGILLFLRILHESIKYWACKIVTIHIVHTILSQD